MSSRAPFLNSMQRPTRVIQDELGPPWSQQDENYMRQIMNWKLRIENRPPPSHCLFCESIGVRQELWLYQVSWTLAHWQCPRFCGFPMLSKEPVDKYICERDALSEDIPDPPPWPYPDQGWPAGQPPDLTNKPTTSAHRDPSLNTPVYSNYVDLNISKEVVHPSILTRIQDPVTSLNLTASSGRSPKMHSPQAALSHSAISPNQPIPMQTHANIASERENSVISSKYSDPRQNTSSLLHWDNGEEGDDIMEDVQDVVQESVSETGAVPEQSAHSPNETCDQESSVCTDKQDDSRQGDPNLEASEEGGECSPSQVKSDRRTRLVDDPLEIKKVRADSKIRNTWIKKISKMWTNHEPQFESILGKHLQDNFETRGFPGKYNSVRRIDDLINLLRQRNNPDAVADTSDVSDARPTIKTKIDGPKRTPEICDKRERSNKPKRSEEVVHRLRHRTLSPSTKNTPPSSKDYETCYDRRTLVKDQASDHSTQGHTVNLTPIDELPNKEINVETREVESGVKSERAEEAPASNTLPVNPKTPLTLNISTACGSGSTVDLFADLSSPQKSSVSTPPSPGHIQNKLYEEASKSLRKSKKGHVSNGTPQDVAKLNKIIKELGNNSKASTSENTVPKKCETFEQLKLKISVGRHAKRKASPVEPFSLPKKKTPKLKPLIGHKFDAFPLSSSTDATTSSKPGSATPNPKTELSGWRKRLAQTHEQRLKEKMLASTSQRKANEFMQQQHMMVIGDDTGSQPQTYNHLHYANDPFAPIDSAGVSPLAHESSSSLPLSYDYAEAGRSLVTPSNHFPPNQPNPMQIYPHPMHIDGFEELHNMNGFANDNILVPHDQTQGLADYFDI